MWRAQGNQVKLWLMVSRPGLWFQTIWLYLLPTQPTDAIAQPRFWLGLLFVTAPLNLLVYGWNDSVDSATDAHNPRKGNYWFGAKASPEQLRKWPLVCAALVAPFVVIMTWLEPFLLIVVFGIVASNALYNGPGWGLRGKPPWELINILGYLLVLPLSVGLNATPQLPWETYAYLGIFCVKAHLMGEIMDVEPDRLAGRRTTATELGQRITKLIIMGLVAAEALILNLRFGETLLSGFLVAMLAWLVFDWFRYRRYGSTEHRLFAIAMNGSGYASIAWVWWHQGLQV